ncbi:MAG: hypothetical protein M0Q53_08005 [Prolixibacteraceae bacterium]|jgi:hypothetical protein|nr:hypothetical protein [Prolixibacteraceae bacterium]
MRILLLYDNFIRDYRGLLLLAEFLNHLGNKVWIKAGWNDPFSFCEFHKIQALVTGQIAESATHKYGRYCTEKNILLVINTSEPVTNKKNFEMLITYNTSDSNQYIIDLQSIGIYPHFEYIQNNSSIHNKNKIKYKFLGYPRTDISFHPLLRQIEDQYLIEKYKLNKFNKKYLFLSSFLLDGAFDGVPEQDLLKWDITEFQRRTMDLLTHTSKILKRFIDENLNNSEILIIKKHPWDCSSFFADNFSSDKCLILENNEFITPSISVSDYIIHTYSTASFEAWVMCKPTVSIFLEKHLNIVPYHMRKENIAYDYESFVKIIESEKVINTYNEEDLFAGTMDGNATYRLATEINKLTPKIKYSFKWNPWYYYRVMKSTLLYHLYDNGLKKHDADRNFERNTKMHDLYTWENQRCHVNTIYKPVIKKFVLKFFQT